MEPLTINRIQLGQLKRVTLKGVLPDYAKRFTINLKGQDIIFFHFDVRVDVGSEKRAVVMNTCTNGGWGPEMRPGVFPFHLMRPFKLEISIGGAGYKVKVDDMELADYNHRKPLDGRREDGAITITGDVKIIDFKMSSY